MGGRREKREGGKEGDSGRRWVRIGGERRKRWKESKSEVRWIYEKGGHREGREDGDRSRERDQKRDEEKGRRETGVTLLSQVESFMNLSCVMYGQWHIHDISFICSTLEPGVSWIVPKRRKDGNLEGDGEVHKDRDGEKGRDGGEEERRWGKRQKRKKRERERGRKEEQRKIKRKTKKKQEETERRLYYSGLRVLFWLEYQMFQRNTINVPMFTYITFVYLNDVYLYYVRFSINWLI